MSGQKKPPSGSDYNQDHLDLFREKQLVILSSQ